MTLRDELLTPAEAAQMLRVEVKTVSGLARAGKLSAVRNLAGDVRFRTSDVVQFKDARAGQGE
jgi:excisionase family DNA binding protein